MPPSQPASRRRLWPYAAAIAAIGLGWWWFSDHGAANKKGRPQSPVTVTAAQKQDVPVYVSGLGTLQAHSTVVVRTQVDGQLVQIAFTEGQEVRKGDLLAQVDPRTFQAALHQAQAIKAKDEALLANARVDLERYTKLGTSISAQTLDTQRATVRQLEAAVKADQAAVDSAATQLDYTSIRAPIDGRAGIRQVDAGNIVHSGDASGIVVLTQLHPIDAVFSLPQQELPALLSAMQAQPEKLRAEALISDGAEPVDVGKLELVDNQIDSATGTVKLKASFPNEKSLLWPGGFATVRLLRDTLKDALVIPAVAVQRGPQSSEYVFVYKPEEGKVEQRVIKTALTSGKLAVVREGLSEGEQVVTDGMSKLQDGSKVALAGGQEKETEKTQKDGEPKAGHHKHDKSP